MSSGFGSRSGTDSLLSSEIELITGDSVADARFVEEIYGANGIQ